MRKGFAIAAFIILAAIITACGNQAKESTDAPKSADTYPNAQLLTDVNWVNDHLQDKSVVIIDARAKGYEQGHIPGAVAINAGQVKDNDNNTIISPEQFTSLFAAAGVNSDSTVLVYDDGTSLQASRIFYGLEYYGLKDRVKLLNGGYTAWVAAEKDVSTDAPTPAAGNFTAKPDTNLVTTKEQIEALDYTKCVLLDARTPKEFSGEDLRGNKKGGHIAEAVNRDWSENIETGADGIPKFKDYENLKTAFADIGVVQDKTVIPYCQTNVRGAQVYYTLRLLGYSDIRPYEGSWAEWGNDPNTTVVK